MAYSATSNHAEGSSFRHYIFLLSIAFVVAILDQITKSLIVRHLHVDESIEVISGFLSITLVHNSGIAFGLLPGFSDVFMIVTLLSIGIVIYFYVTAEPRGKLLMAGCALILGGALGNLIDRFRLGYVVDFINFGFWPAFNVADSSVSVGVALLLIHFFWDGTGPAKDASDSV
ncbi:MAG: signal peptidase II [Candidatus Abyssobacteria bacterium SURF_17]|jgi:signal peptidase II|uniref:Lipoprotein signal peptidase n=1 Tax=Candidatus Abyssobacteria bacterium SURF_17 TaxID=2093361 RepID=A0A419F214_9BACT|nr:MAG: signal peptidase II [Candidatus Abyssubacteria bacterium SURF_17]